MGIADPSTRRTERRWAPRYGFRANLDIEWGSSPALFYTSDGLPLWVGAGFTANLQLDRPVTVVCSVKRVEPGHGMGVSVSLPAEQQESYQQLISRLSQTSA